MVSGGFRRVFAVIGGFGDVRWCSVVVGVVYMVVVGRTNENESDLLKPSQSFESSRK